MPHIVTDRREGRVTDVVLLVGKLRSFEEQGGTYHGSGKHLACCQFGKLYPNISTYIILASSILVRVISIPDIIIMTLTSAKFAPAPRQK